MHLSPSLIACCLATASVATAACSLAGLDDYVGRAASSGGAGGASSSATGSAGGSTGGSTSSGSCAGTCSAGCTDLSSDAANCGACGVVCSPGYGCSKGLCDNVPVALSEAFSPMCVVLHGGEVWCWGRNNWGQTGIDPLAAGKSITTPLLNTNCVPAPARVPGITDAVEVSTSSNSTCVRTVGGKILCWGGNPAGTLGHAPGTNGDQTCTKLGGGGPDEVPNNGTGPCSVTPVEVALPTGFVPAQLASGDLVACVRSVGGDVLCWGANGEGEVQAPPSQVPVAPFRNTNVGHFDPTPVPGLPPVASLSMKLGTVAALDESGALWTWGWNDQGQIGDGTVAGAACHSGGVCALTPKKVLTGVARVSMGMNSAAAITKAGKVLTWGANYFCEQAHAPSQADDVPCASALCSPKPREVPGLP